MVDPLPVEHPEWLPAIDMAPRRQIMHAAAAHATLAVLDLAGHGLAGVEQVEGCQVLIHEWLDRVERIWSI